MSAVTKALWLIENRYLGTLTLDDIAAHAGVSRSHMSRIFPLVTGTSISAYLRGRRLTQAAKTLAAGAPDILSVALEAGYNSHEAFTRAFRDQFGLTPEQVRANRTTDDLALVEPLRMDDEEFTDVGTPRFVDSRPLLIAGLAERHPWGKPEGVPAQWARFVPYLGNIPALADDISTYGISTDMMHGGDSFLMLTGVEVRDVTNLQPELMALRMPAQRYAVFVHRGHISAIRTTVHSIYNLWLPQSGHELSGNPDLIEHYGEAYDPPTGTGEVEIWVPVRP
jgi:AraC family transcriptional regulator